MEHFAEYFVIVNIEKIDGVETPIIDQQWLEDADVAANYVWADEDKTVLKKKEQEL